MDFILPAGEGTVPSRLKTAHAPLAPPRTDAVFTNPQGPARREGDPPKADGGIFCMYRLLAVDDDPAVCRALFDYFSSRGFFVATARSAEEALRLSQTPPPFDCAVVDVLLPDQSGLKLCQAIKETGAAVVFLSALGSEDDRVQGFLSGGDDYLCKPYSLAELEQRVLARTRARQGTRAQRDLRFGPVCIRLDRRQVEVEGRPLELTCSEFDILVFLAQHRDVPYTQDAIYRAIWNQPGLDGTHTVQVHVAQLRKKLAAALPGHSLIQTVWGKGYRFSPPPTA